MYQIFIGLFTEGSTDIRFLEPIIERTFLQIALKQSHLDIEITIQPITIDKKGKGFNEQVFEALKIGYNLYGISLLCVQTDADNRTLESTYKTKINRVIESLTVVDDILCKTIAPLVPIQETEAWMLSDKELLKIQIGTTKSDDELKINKHPESVANPKELIEEAIRIARSGLTKKRKHDLKIDELYTLIGQTLDISKLDSLYSFQDFKQNITNASKKKRIIR